jgi:hypothetical protein
LHNQISLPSVGRLICLDVICKQPKLEITEEQKWEDV